MKALAAADLNSHLVLAEEFLNIGKPFAFEGVGIITRVKPGEFDFTPVSILTEKVKDFQVKETVPVPAKEANSEKNYESFLSPSKTKAGWKKPVVGLILACGIGAAVWGGYLISQSQRVKTTPNTTLAEINPPETQPIVDSSTLTPDTIITQTVEQPDPNYKYILEIASSKRAFKRYNQLKELNWKVQLETADSIQYKLFMMLPVSDTSRTLDSLIAVTGRKVYIEY